MNGFPPRGGTGPAAIGRVDFFAPSEAAQQTGLNSGARPATVPRFAAGPGGLDRLRSDCDGPRRKFGDAKTTNHPTSPGCAATTEFRV